MRPALALFVLILFVPSLASAQTFGLGGVTETRVIRSQMFGLGITSPRPSLPLPVPATDDAPTRAAVFGSRVPMVCEGGVCRPANTVFQRPVLFRRFR